MRSPAAVLLLSALAMPSLAAAFSSFGGTTVSLAPARTDTIAGGSLCRRLICGGAPPRIPSWRWSCRSGSRQRRARSSSYSALPFDEDGPVDVPAASSSGAGIYDRPEEFDIRTTFNLIGGQALLIVAAAIAASILGTPRFGLGNGFDLNADAIKAGLLATGPLFVLAFVLDFVEKRVPALQDVTKATQRSVLALLGGEFRPAAALGTAIALGAAAGVGEEMLFRGVLQSELSSRFGEWIGLAGSSVVFGALHAVTPLYAFLASVASVYFGYLYMSADNLAVPIVCHGIYDVGALLWAHWTISAMTDGERAEVRDWISPVEKIRGQSDI